jgi:hypothetical protein
MFRPLLLALALGSPQNPAERDWSAALRDDARALHDDIAANHPGPVNRRDPGFARHNDAELARALRRARTARSYADYFFALRQYVSSFDDGHMGFGAIRSTPDGARWPGFLTDYDARGGIRVMVSSAAAPVPVGATLIGCDGRTAAQYAAATLGRMWGRWQLASQRRGFGQVLFADEGSRYIPQAKHCTFEVGGKRRSVALDWQPIAGRALVDQLRHISPPRARNFETRALANGTRWFAMPSFNGDPRSAAGKALPPMIDAMRADRAALAAAPAIVLDLRGNGGGSSSWSRQIAEILWGRAALDRLPPEADTVDWRVSPANLESIREAFARRGSASAMPAEVETWFREVIAGLSAALARGDALWRQSHTGGGIDSSAPAPALPPLAGRIYLVTDSGCASACLDAVDLWRALGAVHIGQTTSADTLYMEVRHRVLPSGLTEIDVPMKVYRDRKRGSNQPVVPVHLFPGDIADTPALEAWIAAM